ncbi:MAG TPA: sodium-translocating pyrophosphatase [Firmicutes bacterium]|nr:sodium-translocating pyrophosphatase [Bacillota bacterium]
MAGNGLVSFFFVLVPVGAILAIVFAGYFYKKISCFSEGTEKMKEIAGAIRIGARAYLRRQYQGVAIFFAIMFVILLVLALAGGGSLASLFVPLAFLTGGFCSGLAGFIGMTTATMANSRTANAARESLDDGLRVAFQSGAVMGLIVVGLGLLALSGWYFIMAALGKSLPDISTVFLNFGMGASAMALFARVGGGIFTKAADVGADLVGKVEAGIPEDDPRNPAVIADNVGDNVGDVAGMGADLYESYVGAIVAAAILGISAFSGGLEIRGFLLPFLLAAFGILASIIGAFFVRVKEDEDQSALLKALRRGVNVAAIIMVIASYFGVRLLLGAENIKVFVAIVGGLLAGVIIGRLSEYYTSAEYKPTKQVAETAVTGPATVIIDGLAVGMLSTVFPVVVVAAVIFISYYYTGGGNFQLGLYGIAISAVGMLSTLGITLATDAYGPVADNAGGIAEMSGLPAEVRRRTDALDALGNTTAATGKGFAIGSAALTALALIATYTQQVQSIDPFFQFNLSITNPQVLIGLLIGGMLPFVFCSLTMQAVGRAAQKIVVEVRRQFREIAGLMEGKAKPDYARSVDICAQAAQAEMIAPALIAIIVPVLVGLLLGVNGVTGLLAGSTVVGFMMAVMMANAGGSWDNAKKYIEEGNLGGKGSDAHKAAVVGDTVGDPFKDTSGPSLNILIKLTSMVSLVFAAFILANSLANFL